jgi:hypothetical protein
LRKHEIIKILEKLPDEELDNVLWAAKHIEERYLFKKHLISKGAKITNQIDHSEEIIALWDATFAGDISEEIKREVNFNQFKWHIFSNKKQECLSKNAARCAFNAEKKNEVYVMYQNSPYITLLNAADEILAEDFDNEQDVYIFDRSFIWTYVKTHESMCGPYFSRLNSNSKN